MHVLKIYKMKLIVKTFHMVFALNLSQYMPKEIFKTHIRDTKI